MIYPMVKFVISAAVLVAVSEVSRRSTWLGGLLASLPLTSLLAFMWLWHDTHDPGTVSSLATSIFWLVLPSLILFLALPWLLRSGMSFWPALAASVAAMLGGYGVLTLGLARLGILL